METCALWCDFCWVWLSPPPRKKDCNSSFCSLKWANRTYQLLSTALDPPSSTKKRFQMLWFAGVLQKTPLWHPSNPQKISSPGLLLPFKRGCFCVGVFVPSLGWDLQPHWFTTWAGWQKRDRQKQGMQISTHVVWLKAKFGSNPHTHPKNRPFVQKGNVIDSNPTLGMVPHMHRIWSVFIGYIRISPALLKGLRAGGGRVQQLGTCWAKLEGSHQGCSTPPEI